MNYKIISLIASVIITFASCSRNSAEYSDPDMELYSPQFSSSFSIHGFSDNPNTLISIKNPWQGAENVKTSFLIVRDSIVPDGFNGQYILDTPQRIVCMSSTHIAMLDALGDTDKVAGVSGAQYISNKYIRENKEKIKDIGYEGNIDYESLASLNPDLILLFSINGSSSMEGKLKELGIPFIYIGDYLEENPLGKAEWIIPFGELLGKREEALKTFQGITGRYLKLKEKVKDLDEKKPLVMLNTPFMDAWYMPSSESYVAKLIADAGGNYIYDKNTGNTSLPIDMEEAFVLVSKADYWLNTGNLTNILDLKAALPNFASFDCVNHNKVYNNNLRRTEEGGNDCYESGVMNPDLILSDLIKIFHPSLINEDFTYYHQLK